MFPECLVNWKAAITEIFSPCLSSLRYIHILPSACTRVVRKISHFHWKFYILKYVFSQLYFTKAKKSIANGKFQRADIFSQNNSLKFGHALLNASAPKGKHVTAVKNQYTISIVFSLKFLMLLCNSNDKYSSSNNNKYKIPTPITESEYQ